MKRTLHISFVALALAGLFVMAAVAQDASNQEPSLGNYARAVRKDKKAPAAKTFDNDNLPKQDKLSVVGPESGIPASVQPTAEAPAPAATQAAQVTPGQTQEQRQQVYDQWSERIASQQSQVDLLQRELDVEQRDYRLRSAEFYADAGERMRNSANWDKEDADHKAKIAEKQKALDEAKEQLSNMQEEARKSGIPSSVRENAQQDKQ